MDKLSGNDIRALLTTALIVCGVILWVLVSAMTNMAIRQHEWRMAMLDRTTLATENEDENTPTDHPNIPGAFVVPDIGDTEVRK